ncbi:MAG: protein-L-isoaspartate(D-aspartate) O-methyltransferase [Spirochaetota bacterium]
MSGDQSEFPAGPLLVALLLLGAALLFPGPARESPAGGRRAAPRTLHAGGALYAQADAGSREQEREGLVQRHIAAEGIDDPLVLEAMRSVLRHEFVPEQYRRRAYDNTPLPIGYGQTISQPFVVALMTELLEVGPEDRVLEVGTGSGYQAAVLAHIVDRVYTVEIIEPLASSAARLLRLLGYRNVTVRHGDGYYGWEEHAPFDAIIVTAAAGHIPPPLLRQLKPGGRMCIPVGQPYFPQVLKLVRKSEEGEIRVRDVLPVRFVPLTGEH